ncbi:MAG: aldo/keto reductase [Frankiales bacterium]|nr:aldo/keto reductase [Frankiales bacterium]
MPTRLPGTDLDLFPLVLGGNVFGWSADEEQSFAVLDAYVAAGGNVIDTADAYARWLGHGGGESETIIGRWMASRGNRDSLVVCTKVGKNAPLDNLRPETIRAAVELSLSRLQTDRIDLYYAHQDHDDDMGEALATFDALVREGLVRHVAASQYSAARLGQALDLQREHGWSPYVALQTEYNLMARSDFETQYAGLCVQRGLGALPYYGLARGYLTGKYRAGGPAVESVRSASVDAFVGERGERVLDALGSAADAHGVTRGAVALAWLRTRPGVVAPIASARTPEQLADLLPMATLSLTDDELARLDAASAADPADD